MSYLTVTATPNNIRNEEAIAEQVNIMEERLESIMTVRREENHNDISDIAELKDCQRWTTSFNYFHRVI